MSGQTTSQLHLIRDNTTTTNLTVAFASRAMDLTEFLAENRRGVVWRGIMESILLHVDTIALGAAALTLRITSDAAGNKALVPDTAATMAIGIGTATTGTACFAVGQALSNIQGSTDGKVYLWVKTDAGTANLIDSTIVWRA